MLHLLFNSTFSKVAREYYTFNAHFFNPKSIYNMKSLLFFASLLLSTTLFSAINTPASYVSEGHIQGELEYLIGKMHQDHSAHPLYPEYIREYDLIVGGINGVYQDAAQEIANGYLTKGKQITRKNEVIGEKLHYYEEKADTLAQQIKKMCLSQLHWVM